MPHLHLSSVISVKMKCARCNTQRTMHFPPCASKGKGLEDAAKECGFVFLPRVGWICHTCAVRDASAWIYLPFFTAFALPADTGYVCELCGDDHPAVLVRGGVAACVDCVPDLDAVIRHWAGGKKTILDTVHAFRERRR